MERAANDFAKKSTQENMDKKATTYFAAGCKRRLPKSCKQYDLIRHKRQIVGKGNNDHNFSYTYTTEVYGG